MTRLERRLLLDAGLIGFTLTLAAVVLDWTGVIRPLELFLDDFRAKHFQYFQSRPTDRLIHLDIDDTTLDVIGAWPWPREKLAAVIDEVNRAGAQTLGLDVMFPDSQPPTIEAPGQPPVDHDALLASSIDRFRETTGGKRGVLVPVNVDINEPSAQTPLYKALVELFKGDLELEDYDLVKKLQAMGINPPDVHTQVNTAVRGALAEAMFERVRHELDAGRSMDAELLRAELLPRSTATGIHTAALGAMEKAIPKVQGFHELLRFTRPCPPGLPPMLSRNVESTPIPALAKAAAYSGFVDVWQVDDGKVRLIPLWVLDRGRMVPQMGFALACAAMGVDVQEVRIAPDRVTIPRRDGGDVVIPVYTRRTARGEVGMLMDIPWFGTSQWETMYDYPYHVDRKQHISMTTVWDVCQIEKDLETNNSKALEAVAVLAGSAEDAEKVRARHPLFGDVESWNKLMADTLENLPPGTVENYKPYIEGSARIETLTDPTDRGTALAVRNLVNRPKVNEALVKQRAELRENLRRKLYGKTVLVGWVATGAVDFRQTPISKECPGVVVHGAIFNAIMTGNLRHRAPGWLPLWLTFMIGLLVTYVSARFPPWFALSSAAAIGAAWLIANFLGCYDWGKTELDAAGPLAAAALIWSGCTLTRFIRESSEKARITSRFRSYVDPSLVNYVLEHPEQAGFKGEERELSVVFTDLAGFTSVSEKLKRDTVPLLNEYLGLMEPAIRKNHGLVNKFLGDGIMFFFGAPEPHPAGATGHAAAAVRTVLEMQEVMIPFNVELKQRNLPALKMRAGVSTGEMVVGDAGTPARSDYTVLGDRVNFAARLESANKYTGTLVLLSDRTVELLGGAYLVRPIGRLQVVGKKEPVMTYEPLALLGSATPHMRKLAELTTRVIDSYIAGKFHECLAATHELLETFGETSQGKLCALYRGLSTEYIKNPPEEFLGQIKLEGK